MAKKKRAVYPGPEAERRAEKYLLQSGLLREFGSCPACRRRARIRTVDGFRCRRCGTIWDHRTGSLLEGLPFSSRNFIEIIRFYAKGIPPEEAAARLGTEYAAAEEAYARIRAAVNGGENCGSVGQEETGAGFQQKTKWDPRARATAIFGIRTNKGRISIELLPPETPAGFIPVQVPGMLRGNILFIHAPKQQFQGFVVFDWVRNGQELLIIPSQAGSGWSPVAGFWQYAAREWIRRKGMARREIGGFLLDLAFRYNCRKQDTEVAVIERLASWMHTKSLTDR